MMSMNITNNINLKRSPFAARSDERLSAYARNPHYNIDVADLTSLEKLCIVNVESLLVVTSKELFDHFVNLGITGVTIEDVRATLNRLTEAGYINKMRFLSTQTKPSFMVYSLGANGKKFVYDKYHRSPLLTNYVNRLSAIDVKRLLATHQFLNAMNYSNANGIGIAATVFEEGSRDHIFRANAFVDLPNETVIVEAVRDYNNATEDFINKLIRIHRTLKESYSVNLPVKANVTVVAIAESANHMTGTINAINASNNRFCFNLVFTNDNDIFINPANCLYNYMPNKQSAWERISRTILPQKRA